MEQIINSFLQTDWYKFTMANMIFEKNHSDINVKYVFINRSKNIDLGKFIDIPELKNQINFISNLKITNDELKWVRENSSFSTNFIEVLKNIDLNAPKISIVGDNGKFRGIEVTGRWIDSIWWEIYLLAIINQMFNQQYIKYFMKSDDLFNDHMMFKGISNIEYKIQELLKYPDIKFMEFGTRRRFSSNWQDYVIRRFKQEMNNQLLGTSNVYYAMKYNLKPLGTQAHELWMVYAALFNDDLEKVQKQLLDDWWDVYGVKYSIALIDTWGTDFFLKNFTKEQALKYQGLRQDSGDPIEIGEKVVKFYRDNNIDPLCKNLIFSDGLDAEKVLKIYNHFKDKIGVAFGIGTSLTNNVGVPNLSIVVKATEANGKGLVKLSDNISKAIGKPEDIEKYKKTIGYSSNFKEQPKY